MLWNPLKALIGDIYKHIKKKSHFAQKRDICISLEFRSVKGKLEKLSDTLHADG